MPGFVFVQIVEINLLQMTNVTIIPDEYFHFSELL